MFTSPYILASLVGGFNPFEKKWVKVKMDHFPKELEVKMKKHILKPPPSHTF